MDKEVAVQASTKRPLFFISTPTVILFSFGFGIATFTILTNYN